MVRIKEPKASFEIGMLLLLLILFPKEHHSSPSCLFLSSVSIKFIYLSFSLKNMTRSSPPNSLSYDPLPSFSNTEDRLEIWFMHFKRLVFILLKQEEHRSSRSSCHHVLFQKIKTSFVGMTKIGNVQNFGLELIYLIYL